jgi:hypothetical protein
MPATLPDIPEVVLFPDVLRDPEMAGGGFIGLILLSPEVSRGRRDVPAFVAAGGSGSGLGVELILFERLLGDESRSDEPRGMGTDVFCPVMNS